MPDTPDTIDPVHVQDYLAMRKKLREPELWTPQSFLYDAVRGITSILDQLKEGNSGLVDLVHDDMQEALQGEYGKNFGTLMALSLINDPRDDNPYFSETIGTVIGKINNYGERLKLIAGNDNFEILEPVGVYATWIPGKGSRYQLATLESAEDVANFSDFKIPRYGDSFSDNLAALHFPRVKLKDIPFGDGKVETPLVVQGLSQYMTEKYKSVISTAGVKQPFQHVGGDSLP